MNRHHAIETAPPAAMRRAEPQGWAGLDVRDIVQLVWSARWAIAICGFLGAAAAFAFVKQVTPQYRSSASVMLDIRDQNVINLESVLSDTPLNRQLLESELLVIRSDVLLGEVVDKLRLDLDPEYNPSLAQPSEMEALIADKRAAFLEMTGIGEFFAARRAAAEAELAAEAAAEAEAAEAIEAPIQTAEERERAEAEERRRRAIRILRGKLTTRQLSPAYAIRVEVVSADPMKAALIANTVADQYVADQLEAKFEAARRATTWLMGRVASLRERVEQSAAAVQAYTNENQTGDSQAASITQQQIAQLSAELINAKAQEAEARAKYDQARQTVESLGAFSAATSLTSPLIVTLRGQRTELARREAELSNRYGPKHPSMIEVRSEIRDIDGAIVGEVRQILNSRQGDVRVAEARVAALTQGLSELEGKASGQSEASVGLAQLEAEAEANRRIYDNFLERLNETREQEGFQTPDSRVIEPASPAYAPFMPRTKVTTGLGGIAGGALGFGFVVFLRLMNRSVRTAEAVSDKTGLPVLASIPRIKRRHKGRNLLPYLAKRPNSELAEAARYLRNAILTRGDDIRSVLITSALPEEGKMTLAILLAQIMAGMNKSVLVIDADFRRPKISDTLGLEPDKDLVSVLSSEAPLNDAIYRAADAAFDTIPLKAGQADRSDLLGLSRMKAMVAFLGERYDVVIIEGPPVLGVGDFSVLGRIVDTSIVAVEWNRTPVAAVEQTVDWLADHQAHVLGAVLNKVDVRRAAQYGATGYEAHYAAVQRYYLN